jgi:hypothetical protein
VKYKLYLIYYNTIKQVHQIVHQINNKHIEFHITISNKFIKINLVTLNVIPLPSLIHDVFLENIVHIPIMNVMVHLKKLRNLIMIPPRLDRNTHQVIASLDPILSSFILNDHVMHDHTCLHDIP